MHESLWNDGDAVGQDDHMGAIALLGIGQGQGLLHAGGEFHLEVPHHVL